MKIYSIYTCIILLLFCFKSFGQIKNTQDAFSVSVDTIYYSGETIQIEPRFVYKNQSWQEYLATHLNSHIIKRNGAPKGTVYTAFVSYMITKKGTIADVRITVPAPDYGMVKEITRFFKDCPVWIPAMQNGRNVIYRMREMIGFVSN